MVEKSKIWKNVGISKALETFGNTICWCADFSTIYSFKKECALMGREIYDIINDMTEVLNASQMQKLQEVLVKRLFEKTIRYYRCNIEKMLDTIKIPVIKITTEMLRKYLVEYQTIKNCGKVTIDNIRRSLSTFFSWLEEEDYIIKSPMKRIHKVKTAVIVKDTIPDEKIDTTLRYAMVNQNNVKLSHRKYIS